MLARLRYSKTPPEESLARPTSSLGFNTTIKTFQIRYYMKRPDFKNVILKILKVSCGLQDDTSKILKVTFLKSGRYRGQNICPSYVKFNLLFLKIWGAFENLTKVYFILHLVKFKHVPLPAQHKLRHLLGSPGVLLRLGGSSCVRVGMCRSVSF